MTGKLVSRMLEQMVEIISAHTQHASEQTGRDALSDRVMTAMGRIPRHEFVPPELASFAYADQPLPIGFEKTISQPFIVALMTDLLDPQPADRVLEVGTGLGYHTAVLASLCEHVYSVEIVEELGLQARSRLGELGIQNFDSRIGNGHYGWPEHAPFDKILVCAASDLIPATLLGQLKPGGRLVAPTGLPESQALTLVDKDSDGKIKTEDILPVRFALLESGS